MMPEHSMAYGTKCSHHFLIGAVTRQTNDLLPKRFADQNQLNACTFALFEKEPKDTRR